MEEAQMVYNIALRHANHAAYTLSLVVRYLEDRVNASPHNIQQPPSDDKAMLVAFADFEASAAALRSAFHADYVSGKW
jgi:hypothetical protein